MTKIAINKSPSFAFDSKKVKKTIEETLKENGIVSDFEVSVAVVGTDAMDELVKKYYKGDPDFLYDHPILTFPNSEAGTNFVDTPDQIPSLGEIIICYPSAVEDANDRGVLIDTAMEDLVRHGTLHLLGIHH